MEVGVIFDVILYLNRVFRVIFVFEINLNMDAKEINDLLDAKLEVLLQKLDARIDAKLEPLKNNLEAIKIDMHAVKTHVESINARLSRIEERMVKMDSKLDGKLLASV